MSEAKVLSETLTADVMLRRIEDFAKSNLPVTISKNVYVEDVTYLLKWIKRASDPMEHADYFAPRVQEWVDRFENVCKQRDQLTADLREATLLLDRARAEVERLKQRGGYATEQQQ